MKRKAAKSEKRINVGLNNFKYGFFIFGSLTLLIFACTIRYFCQDFYYQILTRHLDSGNLIKDYVSVFRVYFANLKYCFYIFLKDYFFTAFLLLLPAILLGASGFSWFLRKKKFRLLSVSDWRREFLVLFLLISICFSFALACHFYVLLDYQMISDEYSYVFESSLLASGKFFAASPPMPYFFHYGNVINDGRWYGKYTIGWSALLAAGRILGVEWMVDCLCAALSILFLYLICKKLYGRRAGIVSALFAIFSPMFILLGASYLSHTSFGLAMLIFIYSVLCIDEKNYAVCFAAAGAALAYALNARPADGVVLVFGSIPLLAYLYKKSEFKKSFKIGLIMISIALALGLGVIFIVNYVQGGDFFTLGFTRYNPHDTWGIGSEGHTLAAGIWHLLFSIMRLSFWAMPFMGILSVFALRKTKPIGIYLAIISLVFVVFNLGAHGMDRIGFGPRYYYLNLLIYMILGGGGIVNLAAWLERRKKISGSIFISSLMAGSIIYMTFSVYAVILPFVHSKYVEDSAIVNKLKNVKGVKDNAIFFIKGSPNFVNTKFTRNSWKLDGQKRINALFLMPEENERQIEYFKNRNPYVVVWNDKNADFDAFPYKMGSRTANDYFQAALNYNDLNASRAIDPKAKAEEAYKEALKLDPDNVIIRSGYAIFCFENKKYEKAVEMFSSLVTDAPNDSHYFYLARGIGEQGHYADAIKCFEIVLEKFPKSFYCDKAIDWINYYNKKLKGSK